MILNRTESGSGPALVLLHGLFGRAQNMGPIARRLASRFRVLSVDLRNHGASGHAAGMTYRTMAADLIETLEAADALPVRLLGHSMGGKVAMATALLHPGAVTRLFVADIAPVAYAHRNADIARALLGLELVPGLTRAAASAALAAAIPDAAIRAFLLQNLDFGDLPSWRIGLADIVRDLGAIEGWPDDLRAMRYRGAAFFLSGGRSDYLLDTHRAAIREYFPAVVFETWPDAGHWLHAEQPDAFAREVDAFFS